MSLPRITRNNLELLSPAGDMERLEMALAYGADAVYLAGREFGMRASAGNFNDEELQRAVSLAHSLGRKVYVTCNTLPREDEIARLPDFLRVLQNCKVDAMIVADLGIMAQAKKYAPDVKLHVSTQFGVTNSITANALYDYGADTVVLARELPMDEIRKIRANTPPELRIEAFVHGAMCVSFSGRCLLSNYLTGRDANRGQCAQPCRWKYHLMEESRPGEYFEITEDGGTYIMNSRDMRMIEHLRELAEAGVTSFKIEGRMKSSYYAAIVTKAYRHAIDAVAAGEEIPQIWIDETNKVSHRPYCTGFYYGDPGQHYAEASYFTEADVAAVVESCDEDGNALLTQRNKFYKGDMLELITPDGLPTKFIAEHIYNAAGEEVEDTRHAKMELKIKLPFYAPRLSIVRKYRESLDK